MVRLHSLPPLVATEGATSVHQHSSARGALQWRANIKHKLLIAKDLQECSLPLVQFMMFLWFLWVEEMPKGTCASIAAKPFFEVHTRPVASFWMSHTPQACYQRWNKGLWRYHTGTLMLCVIRRHNGSAITWPFISKLVGQAVNIRRGYF